MVTNKYSKLMSLETESAASALPIRTYEIDVDFSMYPTTPKKTDIIYINGDTNSSIIKARLLMGDKPVNLFGKMVVMNVREGMGYDNLSILGEVIDIDNAIVSFSLHKNTEDGFYYIAPAPAGQAPARKTGICSFLFLFREKGTEKAFHWQAASAACKTFYGNRKSGGQRLRTPVREGCARRALQFQLHAALAGLIGRQAHARLFQHKARGDAGI